MEPQAISAAVGFLLPLLVSVVIRSSWPGWAKGCVVIASSIVAGVVTAWASGDLTGKTITECVIVVVSFAIGAYKAFWQPTGIGPALERATEPGK